MTSFSAIVIGGGAAGLTAAITCARAGEQIAVCEKTGQIGKKVLASGNGRCNLLNEDLSPIHYNEQARRLVTSIFERFGRKESETLFESLGLKLYAKDGRVFPVTNQSASVVKALEMELARLAVPVIFSFDCVQVKPTAQGVLVTARDGRQFNCSRLIITGGGKTYPAYGSDGSAYELAQQIGHTIVTPVPAAVPLEVKDSLCQVLQGQRIIAAVRHIIDGKFGKTLEGELLFTKYGLSGTCILDVSTEVSVALNRRGRRDVYVSVDLVPFLTRGLLTGTLQQRRNTGWSAEDMLVGILPNKLSFALRDLFRHNDLSGAVAALKDRRFKIAATRGWNEAEFTSGGVSVDEVDPRTLESRLVKGVYFAGEILDVNGERGGYNLAWAWASGWITGTGPSWSS